MFIQQSVKRRQSCLGRRREAITEDMMRNRSDRSTKLIKKFCVFAEEKSIQTA